MNIAELRSQLAALGKSEEFSVRGVAQQRFRERLAAQRGENNRSDE